MKIMTVSVKVAKMFSDGNYGHQECEVSYTAELDYGDDIADATQSLLARAAGWVHDELSKSETLAIRRAINPPARLCGICQQPLGDWDNYTHKACEEQKRAERDAARAAQKPDSVAYPGAALGLSPLNMHDDDQEVIDGSDLSEQEVEWLPEHNAAVAAQGPSDDR